jgi:spore coat polysaccharide biosynthesis protein SpsF
VIQARLDSTRLPGKSLLPLGGRPLILRVMQAFREAPWQVRVLACPADCAAAFGPLAAEAGFALLEGPKDDVLARYALAARRFALDRIVRVTGDNPFTFPDAAAALAREAELLGADYAGYTGLPYGAGAEVISAEALFRAEALAEQPFEREHVCPYLYTHPEQFLLHRPLAPRRWQAPALRLSVDTIQDYDRAAALYAALDFSGGPFPPGETIIAAAGK